MRGKSSVALQVCLAAVPLSLNSAALPPRDAIAPDTTATTPCVQSAEVKTAAAEGHTELHKNDLAGLLIPKRYRILCESLRPTAIC